MRTATVPPHRNWSATVPYSFTEVHRPGTLEELRSVVATPGALRVIGTGHSFTDLPDAQRGVSLERMRDVEVTEDRRAVRVQAGATFSDVAQALQPTGLALANLASLPHINVAGGVATATHGSGLLNGNLATMVRSLELVLATGDVVTLRRGDPDFEGVVVALGTLGVVASLELDVVADVPWRQVVMLGLPEDEIGERLAEVHGLGSSVSIFTQWDGRPARVWVKRRDGDPTPPPPDGLRHATEPEHPIAGLDPIHCTAQLDEPGWWADRLPHFRMGFNPSVGDEVQSDHHVARHHGAAAVEALRSVGPRIAPALQTSEIRSVAADELWLSPQQGQDTWSLHFTWTGDVAAADEAVRVVEEALAPFDVRSHWGKVFHRPPQHPGLDRFLALRERLDPDRRFVNAWVERVLLAR